jgi:excisionase family DNA binding protein
VQDSEAAVVYSVIEAARVLRIGETTMKALIASKRVRSIRIGRRVLVPREALLEFVGIT